MFIGHWAPALAAAAVTRRAPRLGALFIAAQLVDWAFFVFLLLGVEHMRVVPGITAMNPMDLYHMPYTHSLLGTGVWAAAFALVVWFRLRDRSYALLAALVVMSHWLLDLLVHRPDLTLAGQPPKLGFGLWNVPYVEMPLELALTFGAFAFYLSRTRGPALPPILLGVVLLGLQAINWFASPPQSVTVGTSLLAFAAYGFATVAAWWLGMTRSHVRRRG
jgi:membrane-bound metal-dependent hydrolase YbcI (DUF457 family)